MAHDRVFQSIATKDLHRNALTVTVPARIGSQGATGTWSIANDTGIATCAASQTAATFCIPLQLKQGDILNGFGVYAQMESAGNTVTLDADLRFTSLVASDLVDNSVGAITQISKTADYATSTSDSKTFSTAQTVQAGRNYYVLITVTTAAATDVALQGIGLSLNWR